MMYLQNSWYVAAWDHELSDAPLARRLFGRPVVLYRRIDGSPVALEDRCCHRNLPLSMGRIIGDNIQCGYHGLEFAPDGMCVAVPGQSVVPPAARVRCSSTCPRTSPRAIPSSPTPSTPCWPAVGAPTGPAPSAPTR
mgnify:CR=1 FL=1